MIKSSTPSQSSLAMTVVLISLGMLFATLFMGYAIIRSNSSVWIPYVGENFSHNGPFASTLVIFISSILFYKFQKSRSSLYLKLTFLLGLIFLVLQYTLWIELNRLGYTINKGVYPSFLFAFMLIHAIHIFAALASLVWLYFKLPSGSAERNEVRISNVAKLWHFLGIIWLIMYLTLFLV